MVDETLPTARVLALAGVIARTPRRTPNYTPSRNSSGPASPLELQLTSEFSLIEAEALVDLVDDDLRLLFFDAEHPQRSDPGLYCYLQRVDGELYAQGANHGWSYPWLRITDSSAARWLWLCTHYNDGKGYDGSIMRLRRTGLIDIDDSPNRDIYRRQFADWLATRLAP